MLVDGVHSFRVLRTPLNRSLKPKYICIMIQDPELKERPSKIENVESSQNSFRNYMSFDIYSFNFKTPNKRMVQFNGP